METNNNVPLSVAAGIIEYDSPQVSSDLRTIAYASSCMPSWPHLPDRRGQSGPMVSTDLNTMACPAAGSRLCVLMLFVHSDPPYIFTNICMWIAAFGKISLTCNCLIALRYSFLFSVQSHFIIQLAFTGSVFRFVQWHNVVIHSSMLTNCFPKWQTI